MSRVLRRADWPNLSNLYVFVAFLFSITRISADQSIFVGYLSEDCRRYSIDTVPPNACKNTQLDPENMVWTQQPDPENMVQTLDPDPVLS